MKEQRRLKRTNQERRAVGAADLRLQELKKWNKPDPRDELDRWTLFFREGQHFDDERLPQFMNTQEMRQAMETLKQFSEKEQNYHLYQSRINYQRQQRTIEKNMEALTKQKEAAVQEKEAAVQEKEAAVQEKERLLELLIKAGIDPDA